MQTEQAIEPISQAPRASGSAAATQFAVSGMTCGNCARHVTEAIQGVAGVRSASVNLDAQQATVRWSDTKAQNIQAVIKAVEAEGFGAKLLEAEEHDHEGHKLAGWQLNLWVGVLGTLPLMAGEWIFGWSLQPWFRWFSFAVAAVVQVLAGARFY